MSKIRILQILSNSLKVIQCIFSPETDDYEENGSAGVPVVSEATSIISDQQAKSKRYSLRHLKTEKPNIDTAVQTKELIKMQKSPKRVQNKQTSNKVNCPQCSILLQSSSLKKHIRNVHLKEKRFFCDYCKYVVQE